MSNNLTPEAIALIGERAAEVFEHEWSRLRAQAERYKGRRTLPAFLVIGTLSEAKRVGLGVEVRTERLFSGGDYSTADARGRQLFEIGAEIGAQQATMLFVMLRSECLMRRLTLENATLETRDAVLQHVNQHGLMHDVEAKDMLLMEGMSPTSDIERVEMYPVLYDNKQRIKGFGPRDKFVQELQEKKTDRPFSMLIHFIRGYVYGLKYQGLSNTEH